MPDAECMYIASKGMPVLLGMHIQCQNSYTIVQKFVIIETRLILVDNHE